MGVCDQAAYRSAGKMRDTEKRSKINGLALTIRAEKGKKSYKGESSRCSAVLRESCSVHLEGEGPGAQTATALLQYVHRPALVWGSCKNWESVFRNFYSYWQCWDTVLSFARAPPVCDGLERENKQTNESGPSPSGA